MLQVTEAQKKGAAAGGAGIREGAGFVNFLVIFLFLFLFFFLFSCLVLRRRGHSRRSWLCQLPGIFFSFSFSFLSLSFFPFLSFLFFFSSFLFLLFLFLFAVFLCCSFLFTRAFATAQAVSSGRDMCRRCQVAVTCAGGVKLPLHGDMCCRNRPNTNVVPKIKTADVATHK